MILPYWHILCYATCIFKLGKIKFSETLTVWVCILNHFGRPDKGSLWHLFLKRYRVKRKRYDSVLWQKSTYPRTNPKSNVTTQKCHQNFDHTTIADRLKTVSLSNDSHPTCVVKPVYGIPTFLLTAKAVIKRTQIGQLLQTVLKAFRCLWYMYQCMKSVKWLIRLRIGLKIPAHRLIYRYLTARISGDS